MSTVNAQLIAKPCRAPVIVTAGAVAGQVVAVSRHPNAVRIWLAFVDLGGGLPVTIVFGGRYMVQERDLVPVAPPGARVMALNGLDAGRTKKMRNRKYRGQRSHGMLCSLDELGWTVDGPDEVAVLRRLKPGDSLDFIDKDRRVEHVVRPWCFRRETDTVVLDTITEHRTVGSPNLVARVSTGNAWFAPPAAVHHSA
jgi:tRNA-binding EMAP/Myf-like protein